MEITAVIIDAERTFADALAIRLNAEEDLSVVAVAQPTATTMGWHADIILLDVDLTGSMRLCRATSGAPHATAGDHAQPHVGAGPDRGRDRGRRSRLGPQG